MERQIAIGAPWAGLLLDRLKAALKPGRARIKRYPGSCIRPINRAG